MISAHVDLKELQRKLVGVAADFGEANETGIARWGVSICRRLAVETQVWGDGSKAREKQRLAILKDANKAVAIARNAAELKMFDSGGAVMTGKKQRKKIRSADELNAWINKLRKGPKKRVIKIDPKYKAVTTEKVFNAAMSKRFKGIFKAKGGWVGAGQAIGAFQKKGQRLTIGKNFVGPAHKWKAGGRASMKKGVWDPEGIITNLYEYVATSYVLSPEATHKAIKDGGENTIKWYEKTMQARLNRRK